MIVQNKGWQPAALLLKNAGQKWERPEELMGVFKAGRENPLIHEPAPATASMSEEKRSWKGKSQRLSL